MNEILSGKLGLTGSVGERRMLLWFFSMSRFTLRTVSWSVMIVFVNSRGMSEGVVAIAAQGQKEHELEYGVLPKTRCACRDMCQDIWALLEM